jgi:hypothetical protein
MPRDANLLKIKTNLKACSRRTHRPGKWADSTMVVCGRTGSDASASNPHPFPRAVLLEGCPRNYRLGCQKANSDSTSWTPTEKWLNCEVGLDDATGFTRRQCTTMRKLCRPSGGPNTHVLGLLPSQSEYRTRSLIILCSIIYPFA